MLVHVLGTAQDGGVPHPGCTCPRCEAAQADPARARTASSLAVQAGPGSTTLLFDCAPEFPRQMALLQHKVGPTPGRPLPIAGIFLTHAHVGHYLGLPFLGREAFSAKNLPVTCTPAMAAFLRDNRPFQHLARRGEIVLCPTLPGLPVDLQGLRVTAFHVQHRNEDADTVGYRIEAGGRRVLFIPDFDAYEDKVLAEIRDCDLAFLDATFYSEGELKGRDQKALGHVLVTESLRVLADQAAKVRFIHLNHSNPALDPASPERRALEAQGFRVAEEGETVALAAALPAG